MPPKKLLDDYDHLPGEREARDQRERGEREPTSWRDRDRRKDRSSHATPEPRERPASSSPQSRFLSERERKGNLAAADSLFSTGPKVTLEKKLLSAPGEEIGPLGDEYIQKYGYPTSFELLARLVEHPTGEVVKTALTHLEPLMAEQTPDARQKLLQAVKLVSMMGRDATARKAASSFIRRNSNTHVST